MIYQRFAAAITTTIVLASCSPSGNPHLDMCRKITGNLLVSDVEFGEVTGSPAKPYAHSRSTKTAKKLIRHHPKP